MTSNQKPTCPACHKGGYSQGKAPADHRPQTNRGSLNFYQIQEREAAALVAALLKLPMPESNCDIGSLDEDGDSLFFDPWELFPSLYGSYCGSFDRCAIEVLIELKEKKKGRDDLGAEMFREMLCTMGLCDYGTSPRVCFASPGFAKQLPELIDKWKAFSLLHWGEDVLA